jgi:hypothetical protein
MKTLFAFLFVVGGFVTGCGAGSSNPPPQLIPVNSPAAAPETEGVWQSPCQSENGAYQEASYSIRGGSIIYQVQKFTDSQCTAGATVVTHFDGAYQAGAYDPNQGTRHLNVQAAHCTGDCSALAGDKIFKIQNGRLFSDNSKVGFKKIGN